MKLSHYLKNTIFEGVFCTVFLLFVSPLNGIETTAFEKPVILMIGTRPEAIKMIPVYRALRKENIPTVLCSTGQHHELLDGVLSHFQLIPDFSLKIMKSEQSLCYITETVLHKTEKLFRELNPSLVVVQGDTTSAMAAALAAFYLHIPIAHVEAGLRSHNMQGPFPEELNRRMISLIASYHFAPTELAASGLLGEGIKKENIFCTGNTVVDSLVEIRDKIETAQLMPSLSLKEKIELQRNMGHRILLLTAHRKESLDGGLQNIFSSIKKALHDYPNLHVIYVSHPNPVIQKIVKEAKLDTVPNLSILSPLSYLDMVYLLSTADVVATDSGGIQEEAVSLGKPVLVLRNETDRPEALLAGAVLVGTNQTSILREIGRYMESNLAHSKNQTVYGDGHSGERIALTIKNILNQKGLQ